MTVDFYEFLRNLNVLNCEEEKSFGSPHNVVCFCLEEDDDDGGEDSAKQKESYLYKENNFPSYFQEIFSLLDGK